MNKTCHFCKKESPTKITLTSQNLLQQIPLGIGYKGMRFLICQACGAYWDTKLTKIVETYNKDITALFDQLLQNKGVPKPEAAGESKHTAEIRGGGEEENPHGKDA